MKKVVVKKGYTIEVTSWENDGDNYRTEFLTVQDEDEARKIVKLCKELFVSCNNGKGGVGNSMDGEAREVVLDYIENNPELNLTEDIIRNYSYELMGGSEYYDYRVCERVGVTYSPNDIEVELMNF